MKRKVVQHGPSSLIISLPSNWVKKNGIRKGDDLDVEEYNNILEISPKPILKEESITIDISGMNRTSILLYLLSAYRRGYNEINITFNQSTALHHRTGDIVPVISLIQDIITRFIGVEIVKQSKNFVQIKQISEDSEKDFDMLIKRVIFLAVDAFKELDRGLADDAEDLLELTETHYKAIRKFINYCIRLIHKGAVPQTAKALSTATLLAGLDRIIKSLKQFGKEKTDRNVKLPKKVAVIMHDVRDSMELFQKFFLKPELAILDEMERKRQAVKKQIAGMDITPDAVMVLDFFRIIVETIQEMIEAALRLRQG